LFAAQAKGNLELQYKKRVPPLMLQAGTMSSNHHITAATKEICSQHKTDSWDLQIGISTEIKEVCDSYKNT